MDYLNHQLTCFILVSFRILKFEKGVQYIRPHPYLHLQFTTISPYYFHPIPRMTGGQGFRKNDLLTWLDSSDAHLRWNAWFE